MKREALPDTEPVASQAPASLHQPAGIHLLADLNGIAADKLSSCASLEQLLRAAAQAASARVLHSHFHGFGEGQGVTGVVLLAESHMSIHTWPECGFAAVDIFMCGSAQPQLALALIESALTPVSSQIQTIKRGPPAAHRAAMAAPR